jgi:hypothetical protein
MKLARIYKHCRAVRENIERTLASSTVDGMYVKATFRPLRKFLTGFCIIHFVAAGTEKPQQQHQHKKECV